MNNFNTILGSWTPVIGVEIHLQLLTKTKMFSSCAWDYNESPNTLTCPVTMAYPGTLPIINKEAVIKAVMVGKALNCDINNFSEFSRKHYFYPDLPKGYQISQYDKPICGKGFLEVDLDNSSHTINITRAHLEEDSGKMLHGADNISYIDYNRSGAPLIEIVTEPDFRSPELVVAFLKKMKNQLEYIGVSDCDMEKGNLRVDLNVSVMKKNSTNFGVRREVKNLNSFRSVDRAIRYEVEEQVKMLTNNLEIQQSTLIWDEGKNETKVIRVKEDANDYRYFPEPDLPPLTLSHDMIKNILIDMPELPDQKSKRFKDEYNINNEDLKFLMSTKQISEYFEKAAKIFDKYSMIVNWIRVYIMQIVNRDKIEIENFSITPERLVEILELLSKDIITKESAKKVFDEMIGNNKMASNIVEELGLNLSNDEDELEVIIKNVLSDNPAELDRLKNGEDKLIKFFMGLVMRETKGKYPPKSIIDILNKSI